MLRTRLSFLCDALDKVGERLRILDTKVEKRSTLERLRLLSVSCMNDCSACQNRTDHRQERSYGEFQNVMRCSFRILSQKLC